MIAPSSLRRTRRLLAAASRSTAAGRRLVCGVVSSVMSLQFVQATVLPVVHGRDFDSKRSGGLLVAQALADDQADRRLFVRREPLQRRGDPIFFRRALRRAFGRFGPGGRARCLGVLAESLRAAVAALDEIVRDLQEITHRQLEPFKILQIQQADEDLLGDVLGLLGRQGSPGEAEDTLVVGLEQVQDGAGARCGIRHGRLLVQANAVTYLVTDERGSNRIPAGRRRPAGAAALVASAASIVGSGLSAGFRLPPVGPVGRATYVLARERRKKRRIFSTLDLPPRSYSTLSLKGSPPIGLVWASVPHGARRTGRPGPFNRREANAQPRMAGGNPGASRASLSSGSLLTPHQEAPAFEASESITVSRLRTLMLEWIGRLPEAGRRELAARLRASMAQIAASFGRASIARTLAVPDPLHALAASLFAEFAAQVDMTPVELASLIDDAGGQCAHATVELCLSALEPAPGTIADSIDAGRAA